MFRTRPAARLIGFVAIGLVVALVATLAVPVKEWRTGDQDTMPLTWRPAAALPPDDHKLWIDTDAACDAGRTTDPDDCLAIALLLQSRAFEIEGVSTTFGNAARDVVDTTVAALLAQWPQQVKHPVPQYPGAARPLAEGGVSTAASEAIGHALAADPLVIVALGPLTNVAQALRDRPALQARVVRVIAVMGRRPGHLFHPAAGVHARSFLGHGPVMRDFNYAKDPAAVEAILQMNVPLTLVPYDAATAIELNAARLDRLAETGPVMRWATARSRQWLDYWRHDIGRRGFFPFDLLAAAYLLEPQRFGCADVGARVGTDEKLFAPFFRPRALLVTGSPEDRWVEYCGHADAGLMAKQLDGASQAPP